MTLTDMVQACFPPLPRRVYEVCLPGFDGSTDATDDKVVWVLATQDQLQALNLRFCDTIVSNDDPSIDYVLPRDRETLVALTQPDTKEQS